ncbi:hypothetical protein Q6A78_08995, partial [Aliarcobacter skirrowii]|nr:hypothetical protein [Aliarcobacter skirrowii]
MKNRIKKYIESFEELFELRNYSFVNNLNPDPETNLNKDNKFAREIFSGHYVEVEPTAIKEPIYVV